MTGCAINAPPPQITDNNIIIKNLIAVNLCLLPPCGGGFYQKLKELPLIKRIIF
jgi:hypothetical protein